MHRRHLAASLQVRCVVIDGVTPEEAIAESS
jgi:hypothetical protein